MTEYHPFSGLASLLRNRLQPQVDATHYSPDERRQIADEASSAATALAVFLSTLGQIMVHADPHVWREIDNMGGLGSFLALAGESILALNEIERAAGLETDTP